MKVPNKDPVKSYALFDTGSQATFITDNLRKKLKQTGKKTSLTISTMEHTPFCNANRHMSNWIRRNAFDFVKHHASTTSAHSVRQIALTLTLLLFIFDMEHWISAEAFYMDLIH